MRSKQLDLSDYPSDKHGFNILHNFMEQYDPILEPWVHSEITVLEIGVHEGGSLLLWRDYFPMGTIVGVDIHLPDGFPPTDRILLFEGSQTETRFLSEVAEKTAPEGYDIIIDDASHIGAFTKQSFWHLFDNHLKPGGVFIIEDWGTGYMSTWPDGKDLQLSTLAPSRFRQVMQRGINGIHSVGLYAISRMKAILARSGASEAKPESGDYFGGLCTGNLRIPLESHTYGMVGFIKQLIDEQGAGDITRGIPPQRGTVNSKFSKIIIMENMVCVYKADKKSG